MSNKEETLDDGISIRKARKQGFRNRIKMFSSKTTDKKDDLKVRTRLQLQDTLYAMQIQLEETNSNLVKEREAAHRVFEVAPTIIKETPVLIQDTDKVDSLTSEVRRLKALLLSEGKIANEAEQSFADALAENEQLTKKLEDAERRVDQLQDSIKRPEEKASSIESNNQVLNPQALVTTPTGKNLASQLGTIIIQDLNLAASKPREPESVENPQKSINEKQQDLLIKCISQDLGFSATGVPIAASIIYKCLLHWRSFIVERPSVLDHIIKAISSAIEGKDDNCVLSNWLANSSTLLLLLQRTLKASVAANLTPQKLNSTSASLFERISYRLRAAPQSAGFSFLSFQMHNCLDDIQVEANSSTLLFKNQVGDLLGKIYRMIRDNLKKEISLLLELCIKDRRTSSGRLMKGSCSKVYFSDPLEPYFTFQTTNPLPIERKKKRKIVYVVPRQALSANWHSIVKILNNYLSTLRDNHVPPFFIGKLFTQIFSIINVQLFNSFLSPHLSRSLNDGVYIKEGLAKLEKWCIDAIEEDAGSAWDELRHIRQAAGFLIIHLRRKKTFDEITKDICPALNMHQLHKICTMYWDSKYGTKNLISDVLLNVRVLLSKEVEHGVISSLLLKEDSSIPFSVDDISKLMRQEIDMGDIKPSPLSRENSVLLDHRL